MLDNRRPTAFYDFIDPASYVIHHVLGGAEVDWCAFEVRVPPEPLIDPEDPEWSSYQAEIGEYARALDLELTPPRFVPWSRKAHELVAHANEKHCSSEARSALFRAHFVEGLDIGRIDVLVDVGHSIGLDRGETRAGLDVDRYTQSVLSDRALGEEQDVVGVPTLVRGSERLAGLRSPADIRAWLDSSPADPSDTRASTGT